VCCENRGGTRSDGLGFGSALPPSPWYSVAVICDMAGADTWHRILSAIERLQTKAPAEGEKVH